MAEITIRVNPEVLISKASDIERGLQAIERDLRNINTQITNSKSFWEGDASNAHQERYQRINAEIEKLMPKLTKNPSNLLQMAGIYRSAERDSQAVAQSLPSNPIA